MEVFAPHIGLKQAEEAERPYLPPKREKAAGDGQPGGLRIAFVGYSFQSSAEWYEWWSWSRPLHSCGRRGRRSTAAWGRWRTSA